MTFRQFHPWRAVGTDTSAGRYATVEIDQCLSCQNLWLRYAFEIEAFSKSGRWARAIIDPQTAESMIPEAASAFLTAQPRYIYGGSYFDGVSREGSGHISWLR